MITAKFVVIQNYSNDLSSGELDEQSNTSLIFNAPQRTIDATQLQQQGWVVMHGINKYPATAPFPIP